MNSPEREYARPTVSDIFALRKEGKVEEAYEAIRPIYKAHKGRFTTLCMFWTASDVFKLRLEQKRTEEAEKIYKALQRVQPSVDDPDGRAKGFMHYAEGRLIKESEHYRKRYFAIRSKASPSVNTECPAVLPQGSSVPHASSLVSPLNGSSASSLVSPFHGDHGAPSGDSAQRFGRCDVSPNLQRLLDVLKGPMSVKEMMAALNFHSRDKFLKNYLSPALKAGLVEMTDPSSPKSSKQRYRRTDSSSEY